MTHEIKTVPVAIKAAGTEDGLEEGEFIGYASVFDNIDLGGDMVRKGAFTDTLKEWQDLFAKNGSVIPLLYGHDTYDPNNNIGHLKTAEEDDRGLKVHGKIDLEGGNGPQVYRLIKGRRLGQMSFAYTVRGSRPGKEDGENGKDYNELLNLKLHEVSLVPLGMNPQTEVLGVKQADTLAEQIYQRLIEVIESGNLNLKGTDPEQANTPDPAKVEEPAGAKTEEPSPAASAMLLSELITHTIDD
jgi:HK97 family phage prohead protease